MKDLNPEMFSQEGAEVSIIPVMTGEVPVKVDETSLPDTLPLLTLRNAVIFPGAIFPVTIGREKSMKLIQDAHKHNSYIGTVPQNDVSVEDPKLEDLFPFGTVARIIKTFEMPDGTISAVLQGLKRFEIENIVSEEPYLRATVHYLEDLEADPNQKDVKLIADALKEKAITIVKSSSYAPKEAATALKAIDDFSFLVNFIATTIDVDNFNDKVALLKFEDMKTRAMQLLNVLDTQVELLKIKQEINAKVKTEIDQQQREYYLNNQLRTIQEELGMDEDEDLEKLRAEAAKKDWPKYAMDAFQKEMAKLEKYNPTTPDYSIQYNYVKFMLELPWNDMSKDNLDLKHAQKVLDSDHFGLEKVKERIIEYLAVLKLRGDMKSPILCLYGPPGVGKTSLGKSIANSLRRKYVRISLGGVHDEAEIRGHRRTYIGAMPGRIIKGLQKAESANPVFILDEIDKVTQNNVNGDPSSALLEVLDPEQNNAFHDNYLDVDFDLSKVLFIATANDLTTIPRPLLDRMEIIEVSGYITEEKFEIAKRHLIPKQMEATGLKKKSKVTFNKAAVEKIIEQYTRESGVRQLEKQIDKALRKIAFRFASEGVMPFDKITPQEIETLLGKPPYYRDIYQGNDYAGVVTGLAWTSVGGEILFIETSISKGKGAKLTLTGNLGDVMKESAVLALEYVKSHADSLNIDYRIFDNYNIHIHVPEGATPKDGPSAGITIATSLASALTQRKVRANVAMTGEITLRGKVLPVGGIKEKILAAKRAGITDILLCKENRKDIEEIPDIYLKGVSFHYVENVADVWEYSLTDKLVENPQVFEIEEENNDKKEDK